MTRVKRGSTRNARVHLGAIVSTEYPRLHWMEKAKCLRKGTHNFFLPTSDHDTVIKKWCLPCPVRQECLVACLRQEIKYAYTHRGVQGGATHKERLNLRRKIRDSKLCITEGVYRWLHDVVIPRPAQVSRRKYGIRLLDPSNGSCVYEHTATTLKGAHLIAVREQRRRDTTSFGTVYCEDGHLIEVIPPTGQGKPQSYPCPSQ